MQKKGKGRGRPTARRSLGQERRPRSGYFSYNREYFEEVDEKLGQSARHVLLELVTDAVTAPTSVPLKDGSVCNLNPGETLTTVERLAHRTGISATTAWRRVCALERAGYLHKRAEKWLADGRGRAPTVVTITDYKVLCTGAPSTPKAALQSPEKIEEASHLERSELVAGSFGAGLSGVRESQTPRSWEFDPLAYFRAHVRNDCEEGEARRLAANALACWGPGLVRVAVDRYAAACKRGRSPYPAHVFFVFAHFDKSLPRYSKSRERYGDHAEELRASLDTAKA